MKQQHRRHAEKNTYLVVTRGLLDQPSGGRVHDGAELARQCLSPVLELSDSRDYPPRLLVLLATVGFQPFDKLLKGITDELDRRRLNVPLVGCSVAGVLTETKPMPEGAALVCLSSRFINARVGVAPDILAHREEAVASLLRDLDLVAGQLNPNGNRFLLCFVPGFQVINQGCRYEAAEIVTAIRDKTSNSIPMIGGVAGDDFQRKASWQFAGAAVHAQSAVSALVESDIPFGIAMAHGLTPTGRHVFVRDVTDNGHRIVNFAKAAGTTLQLQTPKEVIDECEKKQRGKVLFGMETAEDEGEEVVLFPQVQDDGSAFVNRPVKPHWSLELLTSTPKMLHETASQMIDRALVAGHIDPFHLACIIGFHSDARSVYAMELKLDVPKALRNLTKSYPGVPMVTGLVYGEIGLGRQGHPVFRHWTTSGLVLEDQIAVRSCHRLGYRTLAGANEPQATNGERRAILATAQTIEDVLTAAIDAVTEMGFPGSMISLAFHDHKSYVIVARKAHSKGWERMIPFTIRRAKQREPSD